MSISPCVRGWLRIGVVVLIGLGAYFLWQDRMTSSTTVPLTQNGHALTYKVAWGFGMSETIGISPASDFPNGSSSDWIELLDKPYEASVAVYRSIDGSAFYLGMSRGFFAVVPASGGFIYPATQPIISSTRLLARSWPSSRRTSGGPATCSILERPIWRDTLIRPT